MHILLDLSGGMITLVTPFLITVYRFGYSMLLLCFHGFVLVLYASFVSLSNIFIIAILYVLFIILTVHYFVLWKNNL